jgi:hypothetical protein
LRSAAASTVPSGEFFQLVDDVRRDLAVAVDLDDFTEQLLRQDFFAAQVNQAFDDQARATIEAISNSQMGQPAA